MRCLGDRICEPCSGGVPALAADIVARLLGELSDGWRVAEGHHLEKSYVFPDFRQALDFVVRVGELAEAEGHHPEIHLSWGLVRVMTWTQKVDGLTDNDFILAAKVDRIFQ